MPREKYQTLTEQMFYVLLCLQEEYCGVDIMKRVSEITAQRVIIGPGTLYSLLDSFVSQELIVQTGLDNRKKSYKITPSGQAMLEKEYHRLQQLTMDYKHFRKEVE